MPKKIIFNLEEFSCQLINLISNASVAELTTILIEAKKAYTHEDWFSWLENYWGKDFIEIILEIQAFGSDSPQIQDFDVAMQMIQDFEKKINHILDPSLETIDDAIQSIDNVVQDFAQDIEEIKKKIIRVQNFQRFFGLEEWNPWPANAQMLINLIHNVPNYEKEEDYYLRTEIIPNVLLLIKDYIPKEVAVLEQKQLAFEEKKDNLVKNKNDLVQRKINLELTIARHSDYASKEKSTRDAELQTLKQSKSSIEEGVLLCDNLDEARRLALTHPESRVCFLNNTADQWQLFWLDFTGQVNEPGISKELLAILNSEQGASFSGVGTSTQPSFSPLHLKQIKRLIDVEVNNHLSRTKLAVNLSIKDQDSLVSSFLLEGSCQAYQLFWFDLIGVKHKLDALDFPVLAERLGTQEVFDEEMLSLFKTCLQHVNTRHKVDESKQASVRNVLQKIDGITLYAVRDLATVPKFRLFPGTYFLTQEEGELVLYLREKGGVNAKINYEQRRGISYQMDVCKDYEFEAIPPDTLNKLKKSIQMTLELESENEADTSEAAVSRPRSKLDLDSYANVLALFKDRQAPAATVASTSDEQPVVQGKLVPARKVYLEAFFGSGRRYVPSDDGDRGLSLK